MNILHVISGDLWAGAEAQVFYTVKEIKRKSKHILAVILFNKGELYYRLLNENIEVILIDENVNSSIAISRLIQHTLTSRHVEILHVHDYKSHILAAAAKFFSKSNCVLIRTIHGVTAVSFKWKNGKSYIILRIEKLLLKYFHCHLIAVSGDLESLLRKDCIKSNIHLINNGIDTNLSLLKSPTEIRKEFNITDDEFWIGTTVRLVSVKNIEMLIEAGRILANEHMDIKFRISIFGDGELRKNLESKIIQYGLMSKVLLHGYHNNILPVINAFDTFVLPSKHEGLPMSLLEAMSMGTISVCTKVGGMKEVITHGKDGFLVESNNARELAETLAYIYCNKNQLVYISNNAVNKVKSDYSIERCVIKLLSIYEKMIDSTWLKNQ